MRSIDSGKDSAPEAREQAPADSVARWAASSSW